MTKLYAAILLLLLATGSYAEWSDCVCEVTGPKYGGSGTLVAKRKDRHGLVISAAHVFEDGNTTALRCDFPAIKKTCRARLLSANSRLDIAALDIEDAPDVELPPAIVAATKDAGPFTCVGFPWDSREKVRWTRGDFAGYEDDCRLLTRQQVRSGFSGGGRFNRFGEYVGPISGMQGDDSWNMVHCWGVSGKALIDFVGKYVEAHP